MFGLFESRCCSQARIRMSTFISMPPTAVNWMISVMKTPDEGFVALERNGEARMENVGANDVFNLMRSMELDFSNGAPEFELESAYVSNGQRAVSATLHVIQLFDESEEVSTWLVVFTVFGEKH